MNRLNSFTFAVVTILTQAGAAFASTEPGALVCRNALALEPTARVEEAALAPVREHLTAVGFERIEASDLYRAGHVIARLTPGGSIRLYFETFYWPTDWMKRKPFGLLSAREGILAVLLNKDGTARLIDTKLADAPFPMADLARPEAQRPMLDQLRAAGFVAVAGSARVLEPLVNTPFVDRLAITGDGKLESVFETAPGYLAESVPAEYRVVGVTDRWFDNGNYRGPFSELTISDNARDLVLSSFGDLGRGRIVREKILAPVTLTKANRTRPDVHRAASGAFVVGGTNSAEAIRNLKSLNGLSIEDIERALWPRASSAAGFLGADEALVDVLLTDNATVLDEMKLTHQRLAEPLLAARTRWEQSGEAREIEFTMEGRRYQVSGTAWRGMQRSPFGDKHVTNADYVVTNLDTGAKVEFSGLVPDLIRLYGFYEGRATSYRVDPHAIVEVFDFLK